MQGEARILPHHALEADGKRNELKRKVADLLISEWGLNEMSALCQKQTLRQG